MNGFDLIQSPTWEISLPSDWSQVEKPSGELYFESHDETKGLYIATWNIEPTTENTSETVAQNFRRVEQSSLAKMSGHLWELLFDETTFLGDGTCAARSDSLSKAQSYRIASKIIARLPVVVRAAFHDYACEDLDASQQYFAPIIHSLRIRGDAV